MNYERIKEVGPDRACAEWLLRNGAFVKWKGSSEYLTNYDTLMELKETKHIQAVEAKNAGITYQGFPHFAGCKYIEELKLVKCPYICNEAMSKLSYLKESLNHLEVISCQTVTDEGLVTLKNLRNLKVLKLEDLPYVEDKNAIKKELTDSLPNAKIEFN